MSDMRALVASLGAQLRWASDLEIPPIPMADEIVVAGMGGSAISGDYLSVIAGLAGRRITTRRSYGLPRWAAKARPLVMALSYSGNTEETLSVAEEARDEEIPVVAVTSGGRLAEMSGAVGWPAVRVPAGLQPRAALGHLLGAAGRVAAAAGVIPGVVADLAEAADLADDLVTGDGGAGLAADLADALDGRITALYGASGFTQPVATRWKTQINENAKLPAWAAVIPELDHNEVVGWTGDPSLSRRVGIVALRDRSEPGPIARRFQATREVVADHVEWVGEVWAQGDSPLARLVSLTVIGDLVSVELAERAGVDPMPVAVIDELKRRLREDV